MKTDTQIKKDIQKLKDYFINEIIFLDFTYAFKKENKFHFYSRIKLKNTDFEPVDIALGFIYPDDKKFDIYYDILLRAYYDSLNAPLCTYYCTKFEKGEYDRDICYRCSRFHKDMFDYKFKK